MKIVFLGAPGAGKGTQASQLADKLEIAHISTGEMLRGAVQAKTDLGKQVASIMESGQLVPDELIVSIIGERIAEDDCANGFILDGFPRTLAQAEALDGMLSDSSDKIDSVLLLDVEIPVLVERLRSRL
ncbi:UNVERIFIED_CONTAM: hypothetical protein GTU68_003120, partial [Idotea baltica]|nr:hypothetical protein [Idotea baltica]